jgi:outer membrane protein assembly factor BamB
MCRRQASLALFLLLDLVLAAPALAWLQILAGPRGSEDVATAVVIDAAGDVYAAGRFAVDGGFIKVPRMVVTKRSGQTGKALWTVEMNNPSGTVGPCTNFCGALRMVATADGDVLVGGILRTPQNTAEPPSVVRLDGATGALEWATQIIGPVSPSNGDTADLALDASGNPVVVGSLLNALPGDFDFFVAKLDAATGAETWRVVGRGTFAGRDDAGRAVTVDQNGDALAAVAAVNTGSGTDITVLKLAGATGAEIWRTALASADFDLPSGIATDAIGDVYVVGQFFGSPAKLVVAKLAGADGMEVWQREIDGVPTSGGLLSVDPKHLRIDGSGDVLLADATVNAATGSDFAVLKLDGSTGADIWRTELSGGPGVPNAANDGALTLATEPNGTIVAAGKVEQGPGLGTAWLVLKLAPGTGAVLSSHQLTGTANGLDRAFAVAAAAGRTVLAGGILNAKAGHTSDGDFTILDFAEALEGRRLVVRDDARRQQLDLDVRDRHILAGAPGTAGDPTLVGAVATLRNPLTSETATFVLPAAGWRARTGRKPGRFAYTYRDPSGGSPCSRLLLKSSARLSLRCRSLSGFTLDEASQGTLEVRIDVGTGGTRHCVRFETPVTDRVGRYVAKNAPPADCP